MHGSCHSFVNCCLYFPGKGILHFTVSHFFKQSQCLRFHTGVIDPSAVSFCVSDRYRLNVIVLMWTSSFPSTVFWRCYLFSRVHFSFISLSDIRQLLYILILAFSLISTGLGICTSLCWCYNVFHYYCYLRSGAKVLLALFVLLRTALASPVLLRQHTIALYDSWQVGSHKTTTKLHNQEKRNQCSKEKYHKVKENLCKVCMWLTEH